jgi:type II secretory pathway component PulC
MRLKQILFYGVLTALITLSAFAESRSKRIAFSRTVVVNGVAVKAGEYKLDFDAEKNELSVLKEGKIVAKTTARVETTPIKAKATLIETIHTDDGDLLISITFRGEDHRFVIANEGVGASKK